MSRTENRAFPRHMSPMSLRRPAQPAIIGPTDMLVSKRRALAPTKALGARLPPRARAARHLLGLIIKFFLGSLSKIEAGKLEPQTPGKDRGGWPGRWFTSVGRATARKTLAEQEQEPGLSVECPADPCRPDRGPNAA